MLCKKKIGACVTEYDTIFNHLSCLLNVNNDYILTQHYTSNSMKTSVLLLVKTNIQLSILKMHICYYHCYVVFVLIVGYFRKNNTLDSHLYSFVFIRTLLLYPHLLLPLSHLHSLHFVKPQ